MDRNSQPVEEQNGVTPTVALLIFTVLLSGLFYRISPNIVAAGVGGFVVAVFSIVLAQNLWRWHQESRKYQCGDSEELPTPGIVKAVFTVLFGAFIFVFAALGLGAFC